MRRLISFAAALAISAVISTVAVLVVPAVLADSKHITNLGAGGGTPWIDANGTYCYSTTAGALVCCKDNTLAECSMINADVGTFACNAPISDVAPDYCIDGGRDAFALATGANQVGGNHYVKAGIGVRAFTGINAAGCAAGHQSVTATIISGAASGTTSTTITCTEAGTWAACGGTDADCATKLGACFTAAGGVGVYVLTNNVYLTPTSATMNITLTSSADPACATKVQAANGSVYDYGNVTTSGNLTVGGNLIKSGTSGETLTRQWAETTLTFAANPGDASKTASGIIPAGATLAAVATRVLVLGTNCTSFSIGDGVDADLFGATIALAAGTTTTNASWTAQVSNPQLTAGDVVLTANGGNCFALSVRVAVAYETVTAPTL